MILRSTAYSRSLKSIPTSHVPQLKELDMYHCDISDEKDLVNVVSNIGSIDGIFHLAGRTYMRNSPVLMLISK